MSLLRQKSEIEFQEIERLSDACFSGIERPNHLTLRYEFDHGDIFIQEFCEGEYRGFALVNERAGEPFIWSLAVDPRWRGRGLGGDLLKEVIKFYTERHKEFVELTVHVNNPAQKLYFDHGFRAQRVLPKYYGEESGIRMRRKLCA